MQLIYVDWPFYDFYDLCNVYFKCPNGPLVKIDTGNAAANFDFTTT